MRCCLPLLFLLPCLPAPSAAYSAMGADGHQVGFRTLGHWSEEHGIRLDINIWYPSIRKPRELNYPPWTIHAARNGKPVDGRFPLLLLSHASPGTRFSYHDTCAWLASHGFVVAAPTHSQDCMDNMSQLFTWGQLETRVRELCAAIDLVVNDRDIRASVDRNRIGIVGFGAGGAAALLLGGAMPDCISWSSYCARAGENDAYCNPWVRNRINRICQSLPLKKNLADPRVKAIAVIAPGFGMLFSAQSFAAFASPVLVLTAERDGMNKRSLHADVIAGLLSGKARYARLKNADIGALMAPCPESLAEELPDLCRSVDARERRRIHRQMHAALRDFFLLFLGRAGKIPAEPSSSDSAAKRRQ